MPYEFDPAKSGPADDANRAPRLFAQPDHALPDQNELPAPDEWPADFEALAEQLVADAAFLSGRYPAPLAAEPVRSEAIPSEAVRAIVAPRAHRLSRRAIAAAVACIVASAASLSYWAARPPAPLGPHFPISQTPAMQSVERSMNEESGNTPDASAMSFLELTPPEQEAVLDLLEDEQEPLQLSI